MRKRRSGVLDGALRAALMSSLLMLLAPSEVRALDGNLRLGAQAFTLRIPEEVLFSRLRTATRSATRASEQLSLQLHALGHIAGRPIPEVGLRLGLDTGLIEVSSEAESVRVRLDGRDFETRWTETLFLGETYVDLQLGQNGVIELQLGKLRPRLGGGALFDAYGFGLYADLDLSLIEPNLPLSFRLWALLPDATWTEEGKQSPFVDFEAALQLADSGEIRVLAAFARDGDDGAVPVLRDPLIRGSLEQLAETREQILSELPMSAQPAVERAFNRLSARIAAESGGDSAYELSTDGWLGWTGAQLSHQGSKHALEVVGLIGFGELNVAVDPERVADLTRAELGPLARRTLEDQEREGRVVLLSGFGQATFRWYFNDEVEIQGFLLGMTGDGGLRALPEGRATYSSFVGLAPLFAHTSLFFNGGVASSLASPTLASPAPDGAGLLSAGTFVDAYPNDWLHLRSGLALMGSTVPSPVTGGSLYGVEGNIAFDVLLSDSVLALADAAVLVPMSYYGQLDPGVQVILGVTMVLGDP